MSSFSRSIRRADSTVRSQAIGAGLALTLMSAAAVANAAHRFVFTAYSDASGGPEVVAGHYRAALEKLHNPSGNVDLDTPAANTNRCVAYSMTLQWNEAHAACDAAVRAASVQRLGAPTWSSWAQASDDEYLALAYTNRAVMHWLLHDQADAQKDLARARELAPQTDFVARNVDALNAHLTVARAAGAAPRS